MGITIFLGANDSNDYDKNPVQHVPLEEYVQGLTEMIDYALVCLMADIFFKDFIDYKLIKIETNGSCTSPF